MLKEFSVKIFSEPLTIVLCRISFYLIKTRSNNEEWQRWKSFYSFPLVDVVEFHCQATKNRFEFGSRTEIYRSTHHDPTFNVSADKWKIQTKENETDRPVKWEEIQWNDANITRRTNICRDRRFLSRLISSKLPVRRSILTFVLLFECYWNSTLKFINLDNSRFHSFKGQLRIHWSHDYVSNENEYKNEQVEFQSSQMTIVNHSCQQITNFSLLFQLRTILWWTRTTMITAEWMIRE